MRLDAEGGCDLIKPVDAQTVFLSLERADIGAIDSRRISKRFLGQPLRGAQVFQIPSKMLSTGHQSEKTS